MKPLLPSFALGALALALGAVASADAPSGADRPTAAEAPFVARVSADLTRRFASESAAVAAGYLRYTDEDKTGAISFANRHWSSADEAHPSQLWYDARGRLIGADYSLLAADSPNPPQRFGVDPKRWSEFSLHYHFGIVAAGGGTTFGEFGTSGAHYRLTPAGGAPQEGTTPASALERVKSELSAENPQALVDAGLVSSTARVRFLFAFPALWDLAVWVIPNPAGAFAEGNPSVQPAHPPKGGEM